MSNILTADEVDVKINGTTEPIVRQRLSSVSFSDDEAKEFNENNHTRFSRHERVTMHEKFRATPRQRLFPRTVKHIKFGFASQVRAKTPEGKVHVIRDYIVNDVSFVQHVPDPTKMAAMRDEFLIHDNNNRRTKHERLTNIELHIHMSNALIKTVEKIAWRKRRGEEPMNIKKKHYDVTLKSLRNPKVTAGYFLYGMSQLKPTGWNVIRTYVTRVLQLDLPIPSGKDSGLTLLIYFDLATLLRLARQYVRYLNFCIKTINDDIFHLHDEFFFNAAIPQEISHYNNKSKLKITNFTESFTMVDRGIRACGERNGHLSRAIGYVLGLAHGKWNIFPKSTSGLKFNPDEFATYVNNLDEAGFDLLEDEAERRLFE